MKIVSTTAAPAAIGPYSQAVVVNDLVFTSGQIPIVPATGAVAQGGIADQARQSAENVKAVLEEAGADCSTVIKTTCFLADMKDFAVFNVFNSKFIHIQWFPKHNTFIMGWLVKKYRIFFNRFKSS